MRRRLPGRCGGCGDWNTLSEELEAAEPALVPLAASSPPTPITQLTSCDGAPVRTGVDELDRVLGGGLVPGSVTLLGGEPGVGKSTLVLQVLAARARAGATVLYVTGEESADQVRLRAERVGALHDGLLLAAETSVGNIAVHIEATRPDLVVVDSVQTLSSTDTDGVTGQQPSLAFGPGLIVYASGPSGSPAQSIGDPVVSSPVSVDPLVVSSPVDPVVSSPVDEDSPAPSEEPSEPVSPAVPVAASPLVEPPPELVSPPPPVDVPPSVADAPSLVAPGAPHANRRATVATNRRLRVMRDSIRLAHACAQHRLLRGRDRRIGGRAGHEPVFPARARHQIHRVQLVLEHLQRDDVAGGTQVLVDVAHQPELAQGFLGGAQGIDIRPGRRSRRDGRHGAHCPCPGGCRRCSSVHALVAKAILSGADD